MVCLRILVILQTVVSLSVVIRAIPLRGRVVHGHRHDSHATYRKRLYARGMELEFYHPKSSFKRYPIVKNDSIGNPNETSNHFVSEGSDVQENNWRLNESAMAFVSSELGVDVNDVSYHKGWSGSNGKFAFIKQHIGGIPVANAIANVAYKAKDSQVFSFGSSFIDTQAATIASSKPTLDFKTLAPQVESLFNGQLFTGSHDEQQQQPKLEYVARPDGSVSLTYPMQIRNMATNPEEYLWVQAYVCAHSGNVVAVTDFTAHATYNVVPIHKQNFFDGRELLVDPEDLEASPDGWVIADPDPTHGVATGNNVVIFVNGSSTLRNRRISKAIVDPNGIFDNPYDPDSVLDLDNLNATIDNVFYVMNTMHDFAYRYGFTENAGNFQVDNFGKGGEFGGRGQNGNAGDPVGISIHDFSGIDNAFFSTPPDGNPGIAKFFFFQLSRAVPRDSAFANDVLIHEYTHGITNRMTGGGTGGCLQTLESGGMGEGWSDMMAIWMGQTSERVEDFKIGTYFTDSGLRSRPYSTDETANPLKYSDVSRLKEVHNIGEVWANTLYNVYADLVEEHGFEQNALKETDSLKGNVVFMHNFMDGLLLQPCNPTMVDARDAILAADNNRYDGAHECTMWRAFARKGLGVGASGDFVDDFSVPGMC